MSLIGKKCLFIVQGEGRGHMTQSISMKQIVDRVGIEVCEVIIGKSSHRQIPDFYYEKIKVPITKVESPNMAIDKNCKAINPLQTFIKNASLLPEFKKSIKRIDRKIKEHNPDLIINFYEPLCGIYYLLFNPNIPLISVAHQYLYNHNYFKMPKGKAFSKLGLKLYTRLTAIGSKKRLALSFYPMENNRNKSVYVIPPLIREEIMEQPTQQNDYFLIYLLNSGYMEDIIKWHRKNPETVLHCFVDKKEIKDFIQYDETLFFHRINDKKFVEMMANAKGLISTAGFESVCEAMYMEKPVLMVPVENHYEQYCNSRDAAKAGAGIYDTAFEIDKFNDYITHYHNNQKEFREWAHAAPQLIIRHIYNVLHAEDNVRELFPQEVYPEKAIS